MINHRLLGYILIFLTFPTWAVQNRYSFWSLMSVSGTIGSYSYDIQSQLRFNEHGTPIDQFLTNVSAGHSLAAQWAAWIGTTYVLNDLDALKNLKEIRLWEQLNWIYSQNPETLRINSRLEQRTASHYSGIANRLRERLIISFPLESKWRAVSYDEIFINFNRVSWITTKTLDQNRLYIGLEHKTSNVWQFGLGYIYQYVFSSPAQSNNILQASLFLNLDHFG
ncbi:DUF2490 domain-containing protein [Legionella oakridgensis]|uniref:DUF2490 domain-containing protein n=2 Tax=Legionella oakridgensis TaxID=29423 RepID=W0BCC3_9GAMM|nr:DUF2490 domain-containing protein [Legionella oakridgensis]AHE66252.1 hypothetical protein Loa_00683 [Legionella oakridgensis ATCC 33761 = DSM 21215]ETO93965.1 hypothetical protein LOR_88c24800 [Legionella oakridgensis RV-2-2007]KTD44756.1 hypothetical protein Loak_0005 [Legionella oakridgensis]STY16150.1 Protein of uncharacterised function (DUF2490) [Legionella longbeachae]